MELSIIIPAYNESKRIEGTLKEIALYLKRKAICSEIIIINDGSSDNTQSILESIKSRLETEKISFIILLNEQNRGKGYSVKKGINQAEGEYILFSDADLSTPIEELEKLLPFLENQHDIALGSRALKNSQILVAQSWYRERMGKVFNFLVQLLVLKGIKDTQCGFKCFKREAAKKIFSLMETDGFTFDVEVLFLAKRMNLKIIEVPIKWLNSPESRVHPIRDSLAMLKELIRIRHKYRSRNSNQVVKT